MGKASKKVNRDYCKRRITFKRQNHFVPPEEVRILVQEDLIKKSRNWAAPRTDTITGVRYRYKKQGSVEDVLGHRGIGSVCETNVKKGKIVICSRKPGRTVSKYIRRMYLKEGYWFMGNLMYSKYESCMRANVRVSNGPTTHEVANVKLQSMSDVTLRKRGYNPRQKGTHCVLVAITDVNIGDDLILLNYGNRQRFPFGYKDYMDVEKRAYKKYYKSRSIAKPSEKTCHRCCENYLGKKEKTHRFVCTKHTYFKKLLLQEGFIVET